MSTLERDHAISQLLYREARLLDERRFAEWLALWTDDAHYTVPSTWIGDGEIHEAGDQEVHHLRAGMGMLQLRVDKLQSGMAWAEAPPSRTVRTVSNVEVRDANGPLNVRSNVVLHRVRFSDDVEVHAAARSDTLITQGGVWRFSRREVHLAHGVLRAANLEFFL